MFRISRDTLAGVPSVSATLTALAGGGKSGATPLTDDINVVGTVATAADSVLLPPAKKGMVIYVVNLAANAMQVFGAGTDTINAVATATGVSQGAGLSATYVCIADGLWRRTLSA